MVKFGLRVKLCFDHVANIHESGRLCKSPDQFVDRPPISRWRGRSGILLRHLEQYQEWCAWTSYHQQHIVQQALHQEHLSPCEKSYLDIVPDVLRLVAVVADIAVEDIVVDNSCFAVEDNVVADMNHKDANNDSYVEILRHKLHDCESNLHGRENKIH